jgi:hypothetical protein
MLALIPGVGPVIAILLGAVVISLPTPVAPFIALIVFAAIF